MEKIVQMWLSTDPLQEKYPGISTYAYTFLNPVRFIDPTGMEGEDGGILDKANTLKAQDIADNIGVGASLADGKNNGLRAIMPLKYTRRIYSGSNTNITDTEDDVAKSTNMFIQHKNIGLVDESNAGDFGNFEAHVVNKLMEGFIYGAGPEVYLFSINGETSSKFLGSDILNSALNDYKNGVDVNAIQYSFGGGELYSDVKKTGTIFSITGFVGSAKITIRSQETGLHVTIFNITSLTSGDILKDPTSAKYWVKSIQRPSDLNAKSPAYSNIAQYFFLHIPYNNEIQKR